MVDLGSSKTLRTIKSLFQLSFDIPLNFPIDCHDKAIGKIFFSDLTTFYQFMNGWKAICLPFFLTSEHPDDNLSLRMRLPLSIDMTETNSDNKIEVLSSMCFA